MHGVHRPLVDETDKEPRRLLHGRPTFRKDRPDLRRFRAERNRRQQCRVRDDDIRQWRFRHLERPDLSARHAVLLDRIAVDATSPSPDHGGFLPGAV